MASGNTKNYVRNILVLRTNLSLKYDSCRFTQVFDNLNGLNQYLCAHIKDADNFDLHISGLYLEELVDKGIHKIKQVRRIHVYLLTDDTLHSGQGRFPTGTEDFEKLDFHLERDLDKQLENAETEGALDPSRPIDRTTKNSITMSKTERLHAKRRNSSDCHSPEAKRFAPTIQNGFSGLHIDSRFICPSCKTFFQEPYQLIECGHRLCKLCLDRQNRCTICLKFIAKDKAWFDQGFENDKQQLLVTCLECNWEGPLKFYQRHHNHNHYAFTNYFISDEQIAQNRLHQQILSALQIFRLANNSNVDNDQIQGGISILLNSIRVLYDNMQKIKVKLSSYQHSHSVLLQQWSSLQILAQEFNSYLSKIEINQNLAYQQLLSLKECIEDSRVTSFDGTFIWKITNFHEKRMDARSERQPSIYSSPFYSSRTGYKMRLRLFLNGDSNTRGKHMSLYLIIMRGDYDAIIHWPFKFKIKFTLINELQPHNNHSDAFWSDITSSSFQRPITDMNTPYGFSKLISLNELEENANQFVPDNTLFIKVQVDCLAVVSGIPMNTNANELLVDEAHVDTINENISRTTCCSDTY